MMKKAQYRSFKQFFLLFLFVFTLNSCGTTQNAVYFSDLKSTTSVKLKGAEFKEPLIQIDDILNISVQTIDQAASSVLNQEEISSKVNPGTTPVSGFLVDKNGFVEIPMLGKIKLLGLTTNEAKEVVRNQAARYYKEPTVQVRFANYKITILGEVAKPSTYTVPNEKVTILDAISMAGDLTIYGKRENIMLIRDNGIDKEVVRLNLNSSALINSSYFYLKQNDVIYVEPTEAKVAVNNAPRTQFITIAIAAASLLVTLLVRL